MDKNNSTFSAPAFESPWDSSRASWDNEQPAGELRMPQTPFSSHPRSFAARPGKLPVLLTAVLVLGGAIYLLLTHKASVTLFLGRVLASLLVSLVLTAILLSKVRNAPSFAMLWLIISGLVLSLLYDLFGIQEMILTAVSGVSGLAAPLFALGVIFLIYTRLSHHHRRFF